ncbi:MAG: hypothetical protein IOC55_09345 [Methylobacterium sp.]|nr:hypothetical protein [Methylobacterium sp.]MCA3608943.1 hypothetical protein [Methylobacterium sp.]MCA3612601.1 hypothetical protein [Methylobacterium sp.]MCA3622487.1 hypothetical protein [Methylobacterium sp.]
MRILPVLLALLSGMLPAFAQGGGFALFGNRDFEMDGVQGDGGKMMRMRYLAERRILRIEALDGSGQVMLRDLAKGDVLILVQEGRQGIYGSRGRPIIGMAIVPGEATREVAGETCREARVNGATICLSDDGIPLVMEEGGTPIRAIRLLRQAQNPALFSVPKDAKIQPMPGSNAPVPGAPF